MKEKQLLEQGYHKYPGKLIDIYFNLDMCVHSGYCTRSNNRLFNTSNKPWINIDSDDYQNAIDIIEGCPSKALQYISKK